MDDDFQKLPGYMRKRIAMNKEHRSKTQDQIQKHKKARVSAVTSNNSMEEEPTNGTQNRLVAAMINGVINANRHESSTSIQFPHNGRNASISAAATTGNNNRNTSSNESTTSAVAFDHLGKPL